MITRKDVEELYRRYGHVVFRRCRALLRDEEEAMDAMQTVFIRALRYGGGFRAGRNPLPWLLTIATRVSFDRRRKAGREICVALDEVAGDSGLDQEQRTALLMRLQRLDPLTREIVLAYYLEEMSMEETAAHVGRSRKTVSKRLARFRKSVQRAPGGAGGSHE